MDMSSVMFYIISATTLATAVLAVTTRKIFRSAIWLLFSLGGVAALYFWMGVNFIAAVQIIVYVGGIVVLIIFSIFLTQRSGLEMPAPKHNRMLLSVMAALFGFGFTFNLINGHSFNPRSVLPFTGSVEEIGTQLLSTTEFGFVLPFEVVSMLLLAAMIGCIVIAMKHDGSGDDEMDMAKNGIQSDNGASLFKPNPVKEKLEELNG